MQFLKRFNFSRFNKEDDHGIWRLTYGVGTYYQEGPAVNNLIKIHIAGKWIFEITLPPFIKCAEKKVYPTSWSKEDIERIGRDHYTEYFHKLYGIIFNEDYMMVHYGIDDITYYGCGKYSTYKDYPWKATRYIKTEYLDTEGKVFWTEMDGPWSEEASKLKEEKLELLQKKYFVIEDYDRERILATTYLVRRTWKHGKGSFKWLQWVKKDLVITSLEINYSKEVGKQKGSWKGGVIGCSCNLIPEEESLTEHIHDVVFARHCEKTHRSKDGNYKIKLIASGSDKAEMLALLLNPRKENE